MMFMDAYAFNQDISKWDVAAVTDMNKMFKDAIAFDQNLGDWCDADGVNEPSTFQGAKCEPSQCDANGDADCVPT